MQSFTSILRLLTLALFAPIMLAAQPTHWRSVGVGGGGALFLPSISPHNAEEMFVACDMSELFHTTSFGLSWQVVDFRQIQVSGTIGQVQFTNSPPLLYALDHTGEMPHPVKSTDGGSTWAPLPSDPTESEAFSLFADVHNANRLILTSYRDLYFSADGGATFTLKYSHPDGCYVAGVFFDGTDIYVGTSAGLLRSTDGGETFAIASIGGIPADEGMSSFAGARQGNVVRLFCVTLPRVDLYPGVTGAEFGNYRGVYSLEAGANLWTAHAAKLPSEGFFFVGMAVNNAETAYVAGGSEGAPIVYRTTDGGNSWSSILRTENNANINTGWSGHGGDRGWGYGEYVLGLAVAPHDASHVAITDLGFVHVTRNGGESWRQAYTSPDDEHPAGSPTPQRSTYNGVGIENTTSWWLTWANNRTMIAGFSDIRGIISRDAGESWSFDYSGHTLNSMYHIVKDAAGTLYAATSSVHDMYQSTYLQDSRIDGGQGRVIASTDNGTTWQTLHDFGHPVIWLALDPTNPRRMYASVIHSSEGGIYRTDNLDLGALSTWTRLTAPPRTEGHPFNVHVLSDGTILCTYSGRRTSSGFTQSSGVFMSTNGGASWEDRSSPAMHYWTKDLVIDRRDPRTWYVGVFSGWGGPPNGLGGLYRTTDQGLSWTRILDRDRVTSCAISPTEPNEMYVTTETEGLWYSSDATAATPTFRQLESYPFRQPERVFFNPYDAREIWVTSFGNGLRRGTSAFAPLPEAPVLVLPVNDATEIATTGTLVWQPVDDAISYHIQFAATPDFASPILDLPNVLETTYPYEGLLPSARYYWRARATGSSGAGDWSDVWSFTTAATSGIERRRASEIRSVEPNPVNDRAMIVIVQPQYGAVTIDIVNAAGERIAQLLEDVRPATLYRFTWDASDLPPGSYMLRVNLNGRITTHKIQIVR